MALPVGVPRLAARDETFVADLGRQDAAHRPEVSGLEIEHAFVRRIGQGFAQPGPELLPKQPHGHRRQLFAGEARQHALEQIVVTSVIHGDR